MTTTTAPNPEVLRVLGRLTAEQAHAGFVKNEKRLSDLITFRQHCPDQYDPREWDALINNARRRRDMWYQAYTNPFGQEKAYRP